jgi:16S rRNA (cytosine1402-N4)-methyltransferase
MENNTTYHIPVLLQECLEGLNIKPDGIYVDVTFGGGGHAKVIFEKLNSKGKLFAFDQDEAAQQNVWKADNFQLIPANFTYLKNHLKLHKVSAVDGVLADLGVSSYQFDEPSRGFSIREDARLDMRMNQHAALSAYEVVNTYEEAQLAHIFKFYGELNASRAMAATIVSKRSDKAIETTVQLMELLRRFAPKFKDHKFFAQVFQAIRIEVNQELEVLKAMLTQAAELLNPGGRLVVMSYHSLEDRLVKNFMKRGSFDGSIEKDFFGNVQKPLIEVTRHPVVASEDEVVRNSRSRSVKLRIAEKI